MKLFVFSIYDLKAECFARPFYVNHVGVAIRSFGDEVNNEESVFHAHPEDYQLFELGTFDDSTGQISSYDIPKMISSAAPLLKTASPVKLAKA